ncbi:MAG: hypothetical protein QXH67_07305 [Candidatus Bathyarchaeia archaeon]
MVQVTLDGVSLKILDMREGLVARDVQWDAWESSTWKRKVTVYGGLRTWTITAYELETPWAESQVKRFQERLKAGDPVSFTLTHAGETLASCNVYILSLEVGYDLGAPESKRYRQYTLSLQEAM